MQSLEKDLKARKTACLLLTVFSASFFCALQSLLELVPIYSQKFFINFLFWSSAAAVSVSYLDDSLEERKNRLFYATFYVFYLLVKLLQSTRFVAVLTKSNGLLDFKKPVSWVLPIVFTVTSEFVAWRFYYKKLLFIVEESTLLRNAAKRLLLVSKLYNSSGYNSKTKSLFYNSFTNYKTLYSVVFLLFFKTFVLLFPGEKMSVVCIKTVVSFLYFLVFVLRDHIMDTIILACFLEKTTLEETFGSNERLLNYYLGKELGRKKPFGMLRAITFCKDLANLREERKDNLFFNHFKQGNLISSQFSELVENVLNNTTVSAENKFMLVEAKPALENLLSIFPKRTVLQYDENAEKLKYLIYQINKTLSIK